MFSLFHFITVRTTEEATTSNAGKTGKIKAKRNTRDDALNLHSQPRRSITKREM